MDSKPNADTAGGEQTAGSSAQDAGTNRNTGSGWAGFEQAHPKPAESPAVGEKATDQGGKAPRRSGANLQKSAWAGFEQTTEAGRAAGEMASKAVLQTATVAMDATREKAGDVAKQGQEVTGLGMRAAAKVQNSLVEMSANHNRRAAETAALVTDVYQDAWRRTAGNFQVVMGSYTHLGHGIQRWQMAFLSQMARLAQTITHKQLDLLRVTSLSQAAELQRTLYNDTIHEFSSGSTVLLGLASRAMHEAAQPFLKRARDTNG